MCCPPYFRLLLEPGTAYVLSLFDQAAVHPTAEARTVLSAAVLRHLQLWGLLTKMLHMLFGVQVLFVDQSRDLWIRAVTGKGPVVKLASMVDCAVWHLTVGMLAFIADHKLVSPLPLACSATRLAMMDACYY